MPSFRCSSSCTERGYLYRANRMVNWCTVCATAISDLEVEHIEADDTLYSVDYPLVGGGHVTVATVRPVTLLGDTAVAVNPADERYRHLIGRARSCRWPGARCRSSPTSTSIPRWAPARSR